MRKRKFSENPIIENVDEPFKSSCFSGLETLADNLTNICESEAANKPLVVSVDAHWGLGKTTFIDMWGQKLINNEKHIVIKFDAWKVDFCEDPLPALITEITSELGKQKVLPERLVSAFKKAGVELCKNIISSTVKFGFNAIGAHFGVQNISEKALNYISDPKASSDAGVDAIFESHEDRKKTLEDFKNRLSNLTVSDNDIDMDKQIFIFIDELDRCKPTFAIELLEIIKHIFNIPQCCFVIAVNTDQFQHTIRKVYGERFDALSYLERFIDIPVRLPTPSQEEYVKHLIVNQENKDSKDEPSDLSVLSEAIGLCATCMGFSLRETEKYLRDVQIFLASNSNKLIDDKFIRPSMYLIALHRYSNEEYQNILKSTNSLDDTKFSLRYQYISRKDLLFSEEIKLLIASRNIDSLTKYANDIYKAHVANLGKENPEEVSQYEKIASKIWKEYLDVIYKPTLLAFSHQVSIKSYDDKDERKNISKAVYRKISFLENFGFQGSQQSSPSEESCMKDLEGMLA